MFSIVESHAEAAGIENLPNVPGWLLIPFIIMLLAIAIGPIIAEHWWERNRNKLIVALVLAIPTAIILLSMGLGEKLEHQMIFDYIPFIVLLGSLFAVTGGIHLQGDILAKPAVNTAFLAIGAFLASIMGTTGAAMLLIRPLLETNRERKHKVHIILFFIAIVANAGGLLTPLGDPPLFLLYLRGAHFTWFLHMLPEWAFVNVLLLVIFFVMDSVSYKRETSQDIRKDIALRTPLRISGSINFLWLIGIILAVAFINEQYFPAMRGDTNYLKFCREAVMVLMIILSVITTKRAVRQANHFTWNPILEVAYLFIGIFVTMTPALLFLEEHAAGWHMLSPHQYFFATGALSGFLDNAPTALAFHAMAEGVKTNPLFNGVVNVAGIPEILLTSISLGAVFFGAMTYIGNGPNFMIKAIAEENGIKMPSFFRYMYRFSLIILLPLYIITGFLFL